MRMKRFIDRMGPVLGLALGLALAGCDGNVSMKIDGEEGVPLSELDMSGEAPTSLAIAGPDFVQLTEGDKLAISLDGDSEAKESLRFVLKDGQLGIMRADGWNGKGKVTVNVTMPAPGEIAIGGSGSVKAPRMAKDAEIAIGGSGSVEIDAMESDSLDIAIGGSGKVMASGRADTLSLAIGGSGNLVAPDLQVTTAEISVAGSGDAEFASDGTVTASIGGAGNIKVHGSAKCELSSFGSGKLTCQPRSGAAPKAPAAPEGPVAPEGPSAPTAPEAPEAP